MNDGFFVSYYAIKCQYALNALFEIYTDVGKTLMRHCQLDNRILTLILA
jgi:hypothetical protein